MKHGDFSKGVEKLKLKTSVTEVGHLITLDLRPLLKEVDFGHIMQESGVAKIYLKDKEATAANKIVGKAMDKKELIASLKEMGIEVEDGKVKKTDLEKVVAANKPEKFIVDDKTKLILYIGPEDWCEKQLAYFLNHGHDAYISDSALGYKENDFTTMYHPRFPSGFAK